MQRIKGKYNIKDIEVCTGACGDVVDMVSESAGKATAEAVRGRLSDGERRLMQVYRDRFAGEWVTNADILDFAGFYGAVSRFIGDNDRQLGVDLGTGSGEMLGYMPCRTVFGVDINIRLLEAARDRFRGMDIGMPDRDVTPVLMEGDRGFPGEEAINLILDDARDPAVLRSYLEEMGACPDLVTVVLPGAFGPYEDLEAHGRMIASAAGLLVPGGELVVAGSFSRNSSETADYFSRHLGDSMSVSDSKELDYGVVRRYQSYISESGISFTMFKPSLNREPAQNNILMRLVKR